MSFSDYFGFIWIVHVSTPLPLCEFLVFIWPSWPNNHFFPDEEIKAREEISSRCHSCTLQDWAPESGPLCHAYRPIPKRPMPPLKPGGWLPFHPYWTEVFTFHSAVCMLSTKLQGTFFKVARSTSKGQILGVLIPWQYFNHAESIQQQLLRFSSSNIFVLRQNQTQFKNEKEPLPINLTPPKSTFAGNLLGPSSNCLINAILNWHQANGSRVVCQQFGQAEKNVISARKPDGRGTQERMPGC